MTYAGVVFTSLLLVMQVGGSSAFAATPFHSDGKSANVQEEKHASKGDSDGKGPKVHGESDAAQIMVKIHANRHEVPFGGGLVKFDYEVTNPGKFAFADFQISDNKCRPISVGFGNIKSKGFGDKKRKHPLKPGQAWEFTCMMKIDADTTNKVTVHANDGSIEVTASDSNLVTVGAGTAVTTTPTPSATPTPLGTSSQVTKPVSHPTPVTPTFPNTGLGK